MAAEKEEVVLLDFWPSPFGMRCRIALAEKGVEYEYQGEDLWTKSELLLKMNPIHKKIPVLIHGGKPVCESTNIVEYIDEVWKEKGSLLPCDAYERAHVRFWADFIDTKIYSSGVKIWMNKGEEQEAGIKEFKECLKLLEDHVLGDNPYLGGETFNFLDVIFIPFYTWFHSYETYGNFKLEDSCPKLLAWAERCMQKEYVAKSLRDPHKIFEFLEKVRKIRGVA
uniref:Glutathione S-transferase n=1 Tax=Tamarix androssowii TaxID=189785 RepID=Q0PVD1_9CARY|nr:glutathione S-transferase [Tamarix androssowii]